MKDVFYKLEKYHLLKDFFFCIEMSSVAYLGHNKIDNANKVNRK